MHHGRWTPSLSLAMRAEADTAADACLAELRAADQVGPLHALFRAMPYNNSSLPASAPEPLRRFFASARTLPVWANHARLRQGEKVFLANGLQIPIILLCKSIPEGYGAPALTQVLHMTGLLKERPLRRLLGVLQMVLDVADEGGFEPEGKALCVAAKLRLLHAGLRPLVRQNLPGYDATHGVPCNHEDMLVTVLGFSLLVVDGLQALGTQLTPQDAEDLFYPWRVFCACMGIPDAYIPTDLQDARQFYQAWEARQCVPAAQNPEGVLLAHANTQMLRDLLPKWSHVLGMSELPQTYMWLLMGRQKCERVKIPPVTGHRLLQKSAALVMRGVTVNENELLRRLLAPMTRKLSVAVYRALIRKEYDGEPALVVPSRLADLWSM